MSAVFGLLAFLVLIFFLALIGRLVLDWVQMLAREWRPRGPVLVLAEGVYTVTDPPLKALRRLIPPLRLGAIQLDLAFIVLFLLSSILLSTFQGLAASAR
ncbi:YggT family protein [Kineococcus gynurae]|uniref:YggT family protein n=1 Tax=Kineococcus gynurae TaxID=452979 RepID=A0ABV5LXS8_9ACTN